MRPALLCLVLSLLLILAGAPGAAAPVTEPEQNHVTRTLAITPATRFLHENSGWISSLTWDYLDLTFLRTGSDGLAVYEWRWEYDRRDRDPAGRVPCLVVIHDRDSPALPAVGEGGGWWSFRDTSAKPTKPFAELLSAQEVSADLDAPFTLVGEAVVPYRLPDGVRAEVVVGMNLGALEKLAARSYKGAERGIKIVGSNRRLVKEFFKNLEDYGKAGCTFSHRKIVPLPDGRQRFSVQLLTGPAYQPEQIVEVYFFGPDKWTIDRRTYDAADLQERGIDLSREGYCYLWDDVALAEPATDLFVVTYSEASFAAAELARQSIDDYGC